MSDTKKTPIILKDIGSPNEIIGTVESLLAKSDPQELIYLQLDPSKYPNRLNDLPMDVKKYIMTHPRVKVDWDDFSTFEIKNGQSSIIEIRITKNNEDTGLQPRKDFFNPTNVIYDYQFKSENKNKINVLVINFGNTFIFTQSIINDLLVQTSDFDLTIIDNGSDDLEKNQKYFDFLYSHWPFKNRSLRILGLKNPIHLNVIWNIFYEMAENEWLCFLNNDLSIPENFISDNISVVEKEPNVGIINHATNKLEYKMISNKLIYKVYDQFKHEKLHRQGWDFTIKRDLFTKIPEEFSTYVGDTILFYGVCKANAKTIFVYSSPIIHYCSSSQKGNKDYYQKLLRKEAVLFISNNRETYSNYGSKYEFVVSDEISNIKPENLDQLKRNIYFDSTKRIIVSCTTWKKRIGTLPMMMDSILAQTFSPDKIIITLSTDEFPNMEQDIPYEILNYIHSNKIEINWVEKDTKVWKKVVPCLMKYKNDLILEIDDDFIYPPNMIFDFYNQYQKFPNQPISGNRVRLYNMDCHCGCASLIQYKFYNVFLENYLTYYRNCSSSDIIYTYIANFNGYRYQRTVDEYFNNMQSIPNTQQVAYSKNNAKQSNNMNSNTYDWIQKNLLVC